jgi:hypothetical protein
MDETMMSAGERAAAANGYAAAELAGKQQLEAMRRDLREILDGMRITLVMIQRLESMMTGQQPQLSALHQWMSGLSERVRQMENGGGV